MRKVNFCLKIILYLAFVEDSRSLALNRILHICVFLDTDSTLPNIAVILSTQAFSHLLLPKTTYLGHRFHWQVTACKDDVSSDL
jgi:hypothetical protein